ncbi:DEAD/DEAH box helicase domain [Dillenia turbinata]|uniref:DEAD-box ATP-dependent RNA helicase 41 n=1 Tax=Dillenia turbinata TaxID=194707 RepID=A0AAN8W5L9_9MAGN
MEPDSGDDVKKRSLDQREALPGEPHCVVCGRFGEYICDETDDDICSLECKQSLLQKAAKNNVAIGAPVHRLPATDECVYVRDTDNKSEDTCSQIESLRKKFEITVKGDVVPAPICSFSSCDLLQKLLQNIEALRFEIPTPVQMQAIPAAFTGRSLLVSAGTGSGKTASFLVPIVTRCAKINLEHPREQTNPIAIVLTPTRELSMQVEEHAKMLGKGLPFKTVLVIGGDALAGQIHRIQKGMSLIIGTPGRLIDLLMKHDIELVHVSILVLDEVDCMLQRGFRSQVMQIFQALSQPQVLMYSATISQEVEQMAHSMAKDIIYISVGNPNRPTKSVKQLAIWVEPKQKKQKLFDILMSKLHFTPPAVVFVGSRLGADLLSNAITVTTGIKAFSVHGEKPMKERREIMQSFLIGEVPVIVSTGILGRGVDLGVRQVIVFDLPNTINEYIHLIGRASRMGELGTAIVLVNDENQNILAHLVDSLKSSGAAIPRELVKFQKTVGCISNMVNKKKRKLGG